MIKIKSEGILIMLSIIVATLLVSLVLNVVMRKINLPTIIGYIITGTIIAYSFNLHDAVHNHELKEIAEFGVVFLMFTIGLEFSVQQLKRMRYEVFIAGSLQVLITTVVVYLLNTYILGIEQKVSLILALAVALSSTAIVLKTFNETGEITRRYGQRTLGILIMQDIAVIPILLMIGFMANTDDKLSFIILEMLAGGAVLLLSMWLIGKYLLNPFFEEITKTKSDELFVGTILFLAIGASYFAHELGFSYSLGAFIAGMLIAETRYKYQAEADLIPFRDLLLGVFFITVGMQIDFNIIFSYLHIIALLLVSIMVLKFSIIYMIVRSRENKRTSFKTALSLVQVGEFSLALLELARTNDLIGPPYGQVMIVTIVISMIITPLILKNLSRLTDRFVKRDEGFEEPVFESEGFQNHTVILGIGEFGQNVARMLKERGEFYLAIENKISTVQKLQDLGEPIMFGNAVKKDILKKADIHLAKKVIVAIDNPEKQYHICEILKDYIDPDKIIVKVHSNQEKEQILHLGIEQIVVENRITSKFIAELVF
jgi:CPA2 family monovalent cation:H+ antiporter-2